MTADHDHGELLHDTEGSYRMVDGRKIYQIEEKTERDISLNQAINDYRASRCSSPGAYLKSKFQ